MSSFYLKNMLRVVEKIPGINLLQLAHFGHVNVLMFPKVGTRSIRNSLLEYEGMGDNRIEAWHSMSYVTKGDFLCRYNNLDTIVVLRDPLERLYSCWKQKISGQRDDGFFYFFQYYPLIRPGMDFLSFLKSINKLPTALYEKHFLPLDYYLGCSDKRNYRFVGLADLDCILAEILGDNSLVKRANVTKGTNMPLDAVAFFEEYLKPRYAFDFYMLDNLS
ncbi:MAG: hypothetical protein K6L74_12630 [Neptuniibacter sp.]